MTLSRDANALLQRSTVQVKRLQQASRRLAVIPQNPERGAYLVESESQPLQFYEVALEPDALTGQCSCPWAQHGGINCKHIMAALRARYAPHSAISFWRTRRDARRQHRHILMGENLFATIRPRRA